MHKVVSRQENLLVKKIAKRKIKTSQTDGRNIYKTENYTLYTVRVSTVGRNIDNMLTGRNKTKLEILPAVTSTINSKQMETRNNFNVTKMCPKDTNYTDVTSD